MPWRALNLAADTLTKHFGHTRGPVKWEMISEGGSSYYRPSEDKIFLIVNFAFPRSFLTAAHEYGHALHEKALGGGWRLSRCDREHRNHPYRATSYECALQEGFADYAGVVGSGFLENCIEYLGTPEGGGGWCEDITHEQKPEIEWWVAALFMDLIDDNDNYEKGDETEYSGYYIAKVFKSCEVKGKWLVFSKWRDRNKVSDIVWCLERAVHGPTHREVFPDVTVPDDVRDEVEGRELPPDWNPFHIRGTSING